MSLRLDVIRSSLTPPQNRIIHYRKTYPLDRSQVRDHIYSEKYRRIVDKCFDVMMERRDIFKHGDIEDYDRKIQREAGAKMVTSYHRLRPVNPLDFEKDPNQMYFSAHATYCFDPGMSVRTDITIMLYTKTIINFHRPESKAHKQFVHDGLTAKDIGCFGLTQIGHGSDTKNLQTQAIYDHSSKTFTLNTPKDSALKFWIGGLAEIANMALIWAQLIIKGKKHGVHPFVVPIRDRKTLLPFNGVRIGDCGSKIGLQLIDNGYIGFDNYKIPAENILDRVSGADENGEFRTVVESLDKRHGVYMGPLSLGRAFITLNATGASNSALLIGIKYACSRRQFESPTNKNEEQLLIDYPSVRFRLMPHLATSFMYTLVGAHIVRLYGDNNKELITPKSKIANDLHAISAVAKAKVSWFCTEVIGSIRHLLGGHGYSSYSRLGRLYFDQEVNTTWEGDNHMLLQQSFKAVLKSVQRLQTKEDPSHLLNFINNNIKLPESWSKVDLEPLETIEKIFQKRFQEIYAQTINYMIQLKGNNLAQMDIWNQTQAYHGKKLSLLFCDIYYIRFLRKKISKMTGSVKEVAENSFRLWAYFVLEKERWNTFEVRTVLQELIKELCDWLAPRSISLIEAISSPQEIIGSPFADWNGDLMWDKYLGLIYSGKDTFSSVSYSQQIIDQRGKK